MYFTGKDLIGRLLMKDASKRIGGGPAGAREIMEHDFFASINWRDLEDKKVFVGISIDLLYVLYQLIISRLRLPLSRIFPPSPTPVTLTVSLRTRLSSLPLPPTTPPPPLPTRQRTRPTLTSFPTTVQRQLCRDRCIAETRCQYNHALR
jgi:hypothetical protein